MLTLTEVFSKEINHEGVTTCCTLRAKNPYSMFLKVLTKKHPLPNNSIETSVVINYSDVQLVLFVSRP